MRSILWLALAHTTAAVPSWPTFAKMNIWPEPTGITYPQDPLGPHRVPETAAIDVDGSCGDDGYLAALVKEALTLKTRHTGSPRSYNGGSYKDADSYCPAARKCNADSECGGAGMVCLAPDYLRWNSTAKCPPSVKYGTPCGCCVGAKDTDAEAVINTITVTCNAAGVAEEGYTLDIDAAKGVQIGASTARGAAWGVSTLSQVLRYDYFAGAYLVDFVPLAITDAPRFPYRGVMLDTSRHFIPVDDIIRYVDAMYAMKMNVFHWHIIDAPSFPYGSALYPELAREGSWGGRADTIYSQEDIKKVVQRGRERYVDIVFELDTPAHTMAMGKAHPEIMADCWEWMANSGYKVDVDSDDCQALNPIAPGAKKIVTDLIYEAADLSNSKYFHLGGDEVKYPCWDSDPAIKQYVADTYGGNYAKLQADWTANVSFAAAAQKGKTPVCWQPTTNVDDPVWKDSLPKDTVYMTWLGDKSTVGYAKQGKKVVAAAPGLYVDGDGPGAWFNVRNLKVVPDGLTDEEAKNVIGASVCAWGELQATPVATLNAVTIAGGAAENFWRDPPAADRQVVDVRYNHFLCHLQRYHASAGQIRPSNCHVVHGL